VFARALPWSLAGVLAGLALIGFAPSIIFVAAMAWMDYTSGPEPTERQMVAVGRDHWAELDDLRRLGRDDAALERVSLWNGSFTVHGRYVASDRYWLPDEKPRSAMDARRWQRFESDLHTVGADEVAYGGGDVSVSVWHGPGLRGALLGFAYCSTRPSAVVTSFTRPGETLRKTSAVYQVLGNGWYIMYEI
jgi:hypothetical protein